MTDQERCLDGFHSDECPGCGMAASERDAARVAAPSACEGCEKCVGEIDDCGCCVAAPSDGRRVTRVDVSDGRLSTSDLTNLSGTYYLVDGDALARAHWALVNWVHRTDEAYLDILDRLEPWVPPYEAEQADAALDTTGPRVAAPSDGLPCTHDATWLEDYTRWVIKAYKQREEDAARVTAPSDGLREALDDAMIVAAILRGDPTTASLANRLDVSLHRALATTEQREGLDACDDCRPHGHDHCSTCYRCADDAARTSSHPAR